ncbi:MAG: endonuclease/exonuclease/phosphatase family protein [Candidatus Nanopelagicales bacterium]|nr:endonuclease/exonuclease/phosphatase family protein [Candidatus Nanopelagicales bacterium]MDZ7577095.1 endonuclease/exonuclease/phosphatase family protein [Candidatus Nanopelagicales bacterium]
MIAVPTRGAIMLALAGALTIGLLAPASSGTGATTASSVDPTASATKALGPKLSLATYNICNPRCGSGWKSWEKRRLKMARTVGAAGADIVAIQEAENQYYGETRHWTDVAGLLIRKGYAIANTNITECQTFCTRETHVFYRRSRFELVQSSSGDSAGLQSLEDLTGPGWGGSISNRSFSWAFLRHRSSGAEFLAVSVHLHPNETARGERLRVRAARAIRSWIDRELTLRGKPGLPVAVMGDLNSFAARQPKGAQKVFYRAGFRDSFQARKKIRPNYSTVNINWNNLKYAGWPPKPYAYPGEGARVDYILVRNASRLVQYRTFLRLRKNGRFKNRFRSSDHNLISAVVRIPVT